MTDLDQHEAIQVFVGIDVGKGAHHAVALNRCGKRLLDSALPNDEAKLRALIASSKSMAQSCSWSINPLPWALCPLRSHAMKARWSRICRDWRCGASLICMQ